MKYTEDGQMSTTTEYVMVALITIYNTNYSSSKLRKMHRSLGVIELAVDPATYTVLKTLISIHSNFFKSIFQHNLTEAQYNAIMLERID
ncbi:hypothetical protein N7468_004361 [Penicillium chermesinum]|uniref:BTB domain-containing protein n=1 Tax=Penicillium chermesinum TaxID=63820 RepID=A0A9W9PB90_9EURO|nr:uncharacterized protein N7468_004361 [Penicillium chermesinum]KAJ5239742.1 hypothetical protein N7468_004361 [Penicillium chermesinum]KAJ6166624.1 hypothetical protein N7470_002071 [Penicillium chermesinum]